MSLQVSPDGAFLIAAYPSKFQVVPTAALESGWVSYKAPNPLTCLAIHPSEPYLATGDSKGVIRLYTCLDPAWWAKRAKLIEKEAAAEKPTFGPPSFAALHWHAHPVADLCFAANGAYLFSGGLESVLVLWQIRSQHKEFLPRLGAPILKLSLAPSTNNRVPEVAATLSDGTVLFISTQNMAIRRSISSVKSGMLLPHREDSDCDILLDAMRAAEDAASARTIPYSYPLAVRPGTSTIVFPSAHPSALQVYDVVTQSYLLELEVAPSNRVAKRKGQDILEPTRIEFVALSPSGEWMATYDSWQTDEFACVACLKLWRKVEHETKYVRRFTGSVSYLRPALSYTLHTKIDSPHVGRVVSLAFSPAKDRNYLMTAGEEGQIKLWSLLADKAKDEQGRLPVILVGGPLNARLQARNGNVLLD